MESGEWVGILAGVLTTVAFIPQVWKTWRSGAADDISSLMFIIFSSGVLCWLLYGITLNSRPMMIANAITLVLSLSVLFMKYRFAWKKKQRLLAAEQRGL